MMKNLLYGLMFLAGIFTTDMALADHHGHGGVGVGFYFGAPYPYPYYPPHYYYPYPYYPPVIVSPAQPPVYIEQGSTQYAPPVPNSVAPAPQTNSYWYHCDSPEGYYPYIKECPGGWKPVTPMPPPQQ
jgi:hypothetical protein